MGKVTVVGIGPGKFSGMTMEADEALRAADIIVGYKKYVELVRPYYPDKEYVDTGMKREKERVMASIELAASGKRVALVCSGDSGVYGMAGLAFELAEGFGEVEIEVIPVQPWNA